MKEVLLIAVVAAVLWLGLSLTYVAISSLNWQYQKKRTKLDDKHLKLAFGEETEHQSLNIFVIICAILLAIFIVHS
jgi:hypothetical protein